MPFKVTINFRKGPAFSTEVQAMCQETAKVLAARWAAQNGFNGPVKSVEAVPA